MIFLFDEMMDKSFDDVLVVDEAVTPEHVVCAIFPRKNGTKKGTKGKGVPVRVCVSCCVAGVKGKLHETMMRCFHPKMIHFMHDSQ